MSAKMGKDKNECKSIKIKFTHLEDDRFFIGIGIKLVA